VPGHLGGVVQGAAGELPARPGRLERRGHEPLVERDRLDAPDLGRRRVARRALDLRQHLGERPVLGVPQVHHELGPARNRRGDAGLEPQHPRRADPAVLARDFLDAQCQPGCRQARVAPHVHRRRARVRGLAGEREAMPLDAEGAGHGRDRHALPLQHGALLDVQLQVGNQPRAPARRVRRALELDAVLGEHVADPASVRVRERGDGGGIERARDGRAAEQAASEARALLVGEVDQRHRPSRPASGGRTQHLHPRHYAECAVEPASVRHGVDVRADRHGLLGLTRQTRPEVARLVDVGLDALDLRQPLSEERARLLPHRRPADPLRAVRAPREAVQLTEVGDDALGLDLH
jgi:hypothetical protein